MKQNSNIPQVVISAAREIGVNPDKLVMIKNSSKEKIYTEDNVIDGIVMPTGYPVYFHLKGNSVTVEKLW